MFKGIISHPSEPPGEIIAFGVSPVNYFRFRFRVKFQNHRPSCSGEGDFFKVFAIFKGFGIVPNFSGFCSPFLRMFHMKFGFDLLSGFREEYLLIL